MLKILNVEPKNYSSQAKVILEKIGQVHEIDASREKLIEIVGNYNVLIVRLTHHIDKEIIDAGSNLQVIVSATTGLDHIDVAYAESKHIKVLSLKGEYAFLKTVKATAEHTWALLLSLFRKIPWAMDSVFNGKWDRDKFRGNELQGKRLGILGLGRLGEMVSKYGLAFGMKVSAWDPVREGWVTNVQHCESLEELLKASDVLSIHLPLEKETYHLIGEKEFRLLADKPVLINTSRGNIVDSDALINALLNGRLSGAALDVIPGEFGVSCEQRQRLLNYAKKNTNLIITPHIAGATVESMAKTEIFMAEKLYNWTL
jgi:D-3-phosphoglycerate dehydrogenase / 2-oxoglutarate reductase